MDYPGHRATAWPVRITCDGGSARSRCAVRKPAAARIANPLAVQRKIRAAGTPTQRQAAEEREVGVSAGSYEAFDGIANLAAAQIFATAQITQDFTVAIG